MPSPTASCAPPHDDPVIATGIPLVPDLPHTIPADVRFAIWQVLRTLRLWTAQPERNREGLFSADYMEAWERALLTGSLEPDVRFPLAVIVGELAASPTGEARLSWACVCAADWALGHKAIQVGLAFAEAAALASPDQARYAWLAGRLMRTHGEARLAERWLHRAYRVAVAQKDGETQAKALTALGNLAMRRGSYLAARTFHTRALRVSRRWRLREQEGMALHDLFGMALRENNRPEAERLARGAFDAYRAAPHRVPRLAHDVAYWWMESGYYDRALRVFVAVRPHLPGEDYFRVVANIARSSAGLGNRERFDECVAEARTLMSTAALAQVPSSALLEMANGAVVVESWTTAEELVRLAIEVAESRGETDVLMTAEALSETIRERGRATIVPARMESRVSNGEQLAKDFVELLNEDRAVLACA